MPHGWQGQKRHQDLNVAAERDGCGRFRWHYHSRAARIRLSEHTRAWLLGRPRQGAPWRRNRQTNSAQTKLVATLVRATASVS